MNALTTIIHDRYGKTGIENKENWSGSKNREGILNIILFADDDVLLTKTWEGMQILLEEVGKFSEDMEMKFGSDKCKVMTIVGIF